MTLEVVASTLNFLSIFASCGGWIALAVTVTRSMAAADAVKAARALPATATNEAFAATRGAMETLNREALLLWITVGLLALAHILEVAARWLR